MPLILTTWLLFLVMASNNLFLASLEVSTPVSNTESVKWVVVERGQTSGRLTLMR